MHTLTEFLRWVFCVSSQLCPLFFKFMLVDFFRVMVCVVYILNIQQISHTHAQQILSASFKGDGTSPI